MKIDMVYEPQKAKGLAIVIDVIRAATVEAFILKNNAEYIIPVRTQAEAVTLKEMYPDYVFVGEIDGYKIEGFDYGNSPSEIKDRDFTHKVVVHRSSLGTAGLLSIPQDSQMIFGSYVTYSAIKRYLDKTQPSVVSLVPTGGYGSDDERFAHYLYMDLKGHPVDILEEREYIKNLDPRFLDPAIPEFPEEDLHICLSLDLCPFICLTDKYNGQLIVRRQKI